MTDVAAPPPSAAPESPRLERLIRYDDLPTYTGMQRSQTKALIAAGDFPRPIRVTDGGRVVAWLESEVAEWQARRKAARDAGSDAPIVPPPPPPRRERSAPKPNREKEADRARTAKPRAAGRRQRG